MSGNLCRCTGYVGIIRAIETVLTERRARGIAAVAGAGRIRLGPAGSGNTTVVAPHAAPNAEAIAKHPTDIGTMRNGLVPQTTLHRSFTVGYPPSDVWAFFGRIAEVAACLPGAAIDSVSPEGRIAGRVRVKAGPIAAAFAGIADVTRNEAARTGTINGAGRDAKSNSTTRGLIRYAVKEAAAGTKVEVEIGFALTGVLAQFGRSGLVEDVAKRITAAFAENLEARLSGDDRQATPVAAELDAGSLLLGVLRGWLGSVWHRIRRKGP